MNTLLTIAVGTKYQNILVDRYSKLDSELNLIVFTDNVEYLKKRLPGCDIRLYKNKNFRYFDKYKLTYELTLEKQEPILFCDVSRLNEQVYRKFFYFDSEKIHDIFTHRHWDDVENLTQLKNYTCIYFEDGYWDNIITYFEKTGINLAEIVPILEQIFVFPYKDWVGNVIRELETIRNLFETNSKTKQHVYSGIGNGEGIALSYALYKTRIKHKLLKDLPINSYRKI